MITDHVKCNWCEKEMYIRVREDICPNCKLKGYLMWVDDNEQEVEVEEYRIK